MIGCSEKKEVSKDVVSLSIILMLHSHNLCRTGQSTLATLQTVWMQITDFLAARVIGCELHRADASTLLALHLTSTRHVDVCESLW